MGAPFLQVFGWVAVSVVGVSDSFSFSWPSLVLVLFAANGGI